MGSLTVVGAGAGSGKTFDLCSTIAKEVAGGLDPARILATTFTKKAAAELKGRIQQRLLEDEHLAPAERLDKAERLERAAIGTVHSVGHQMLTRYAIHLGLSPRIDVLDQPASARSLQALLGRSDPAPWEELARIARRLSVSEPQSVVLRLVAAQRSNRIGEQAFRAQMQQSAERLCSIMAPNGPQSREFAFADLYASIKKTLEDLDRVADQTKVTTEAKTKLRSLVAKKSGVWTDFLDARGVSAGKRSGADDKLAPLRAETADLLLFPVLHADIRAFLGAVTERAVSLQAEYQAYKQQRGLVDFTDLETLLLELLETPTLAASLKEDFDFVLVDEFQDTNPLQLAIFQRLRATRTTGPRPLASRPGTTTRCWRGSTLSPSEGCRRRFSYNR